MASKRKFAKFEEQRWIAEDGWEKKQILNAFLESIHAKGNIILRTSPFVFELGELNGIKNVTLDTDQSEDFLFVTRDAEILIRVLMPNIEKCEIFLIGDENAALNKTFKGFIARWEHEGIEYVLNYTLSKGREEVNAALAELF